MGGTAVRDNSIDERFVIRIWDSGLFVEDALRAKDGRKIEVIHRGQRNDGSGADFHDAEIRVNGLLQKGDVEIHVKNSHWRVHHHDSDPRYNKTILHVAMWDDSIGLLVKKQDGEHIPTLVLYDYLDRPVGKLWKIIEDKGEKPEPCREKAGSITQEVIGTILYRAGMDRFLQRAQALEECLGEKDLNQLLYEGMMEALGYSRNREPFLELARKVSLKLLAGRPTEEIQAILFGVAGLLPLQNTRDQDFDEETKGYVDRVETLWQTFLPQFRAKQMLAEQWEFSRTRPENFPTKRIAAMSYILSNSGGGGEEPPVSLLAVCCSAFGGEETQQKLQDMLILRVSGYWTGHYIFGGRGHKSTPFLIGRGRADDIVVNVILPAILVHARSSGDEELRQAVTTVYANHRKLQENRITRYVTSRLFRDREKRRSVINSAIRQQGLIHIYKNFCFARNCQNCPLS